MKLIEEIVNKCKGSVSIFFNEHRDLYMSVEEYFTQYDMNIDAIHPDILSKMIEMDKIIEVVAYPDTPVGNYHIYHHDLHSALKIINNSI